MDNEQEEIMQTRDSAGAKTRAVPKIGLEDGLSLLTKSQRERLAAGCDFKSLAKIFEDDEMMRTVDAFLSSGMNLSSASRQLYMHRNTLMYRLNAIRRKTGLDLRDFDMAVTFKILQILYFLK